MDKQTTSLFNDNCCNKTAHNKWQKIDLPNAYNEADASLWYDYAHAIAYRHVWNKSAFDVRHDCAIDGLMNAIARHDPTRSAFKTYLGVCVRSKCMDYMRTKKYRDAKMNEAISEKIYAIKNEQHAIPSASIEAREEIKRILGTVDKNVADVLILYTRGVQKKLATLLVYNKGHRSHWTREKVAVKCMHESNEMAQSSTLVRFA